MLIDSVSQHQTEKQKNQQLFVPTIDLNYPYNQLQLHKDTAKHCKFYIIFLENQQESADLKLVLTV